MLDTANTWLTGLSTRRLVDAAGKGATLEVAPAPEPRDVDWPALEEHRGGAAAREDNRNVGRVIRLAIFLAYAALTAGIAVGILWFAETGEKRAPSLGLLWQLLAGILPSLAQDWLFDYVAGPARGRNDARRARGRDRLSLGEPGSRRFPRRSR